MNVSDMEPTRVFRIQSDSNPDKSYLISEYPNGRLTCTCPSFLYSKRQRGLDIMERECKHTERVYDAAVDRAVQSGMLAEELSSDEVRRRQIKERLDKQGIEQLDKLDDKVKNLISQLMSRAR